jgi:hypothetical protein
MAVRTQCPRCKQALAVPSKLAGSYANCPRCQGRFWISKDAPVDTSISDTVAMPSATLTLTQSPSGAAAPPMAVPPPVHFPSVTPLVPLPSPREAAAGPPTPPPPARKVARLVSADAADSSLKIAADGQLPNLQLQDIDKKDKGQGKSRSIPPLVLIGAWAFSVVMTIAIVMFSGSSGDSQATTPEKAKAMQEIEGQYFGDPSRGVLLPYQHFLRAAQQARAREDYKAERQYYKQALDLLRTESRGGASHNRLEKGVTGSRKHDRELEKLIITVLGE